MELSKLSLNSSKPYETNEADPGDDHQIKVGSLRPQGHFFIKNKDESDSKLFEYT